MKSNLQTKRNHQGNVLVIALLTFVIIVAIITYCLNLYQTKLEIINNLTKYYDNKINEQWTKIKS